MKGVAIGIIGNRLGSLTWDYVCALFFFLKLGLEKGTSGLREDFFLAGAPQKKQEVCLLANLGNYPLNWYWPAVGRALNSWKMVAAASGSGITWNFHWVSGLGASTARSRVAWFFGPRIYGTFNGRGYVLLLLLISRGCKISGLASSLRPGRRCLRCKVERAGFRFFGRRRDGVNTVTCIGFLHR